MREKNFDVLFAAAYEELRKLAGSIRRTDPNSVLTRRTDHVLPQLKKEEVLPKR